MAGRGTGRSWSQRGTSKYIRIPRCVWIPQAIPAAHPIHEQLFGGTGRGGLGRGERPRMCINGYLSGLGQGYRR